MMEVLFDLGTESRKWLTEVLKRMLERSEWQTKNIVSTF